jgi:hypothetical protein
MKNVIRLPKVISLLLILTSLSLAPAAMGQSVTRPDLKPKHGEDMMKSCRDMMEQKHQMMAEMKAQDTALSEQVTEMNSAADRKKIGLLAAIVTRLVEQRSAMHAKEAAMHEKMMTHMMAHMEMGKDSMAGCSMMDGMSDMKDEAPQGGQGRGPAKK